MAIHKVSMDLAGRTLEIETGRMAHQAYGAVTVRAGDSMVLVTATGSDTVRDGIDFFPLTCDYEERLYAAGKIPGSFPRREGRPSDSAVLTCRLMDRGLRPLFPKGYRNDVQVIAMPMSSDRQNQVDILCMIGAAAALAISGLPVQHTLGSIRIGRIDGEPVIYPTHDECGEAELDLVVSATREAIVMIEVGALEIPEAELVECMKLAHSECIRIIDLIEELKAKVNPEPRPYQVHLPSDEVYEAAKGYQKDLVDALCLGDKATRRREYDAVLKRAKEELAARFEDKEPWEFSDALDSVTKSGVRAMVLSGKRLDGRAPDQIRPLAGEVGLAPRAHGTGLFSRGDTQTLCTVTLGMLAEAQKLDTLSLEDSKTFMHQYNMPPFANGEARPLRGPNRRAIGHGALAERSLLSVVPSTDEFPYTMRLVNEVLGSDGSTSMASVCSASLAMMDAGIPVDTHVAGMAMGIVYSPDQHVILTDIQAQEDFNGDMDFKVAGTREGVTAIQMDVKCLGLTTELLTEALEHARIARMKVLDVLEATIPAPREELSPYAPRMLTLMVPVDKIGAVIGPGGKTIRKIEALGVTIEIEDDGRVYVSTTDSEAGEKAVQFINTLVRDPEIGEVYDGTVTRLMSFGAFVELVPGKEGLLHVSEYAWERTPSISDVLKVGDPVRVKVSEIDDQGRINVSRKQLLDRPEGMSESSGSSRGREGGDRSRPPRRRGGPGGRDDGPRGGSGGNRTRFREKQ